MISFAGSAYRGVVFAFAGAVLMGSTLHVDEQLYLTLTGEVACLPNCDQPIALTLTGTRLGDPAAEREIARTSLGKVGGQFHLSGSVVIGFEGKPTLPVADRVVTLEVRGSGCATVMRHVHLNDFARDKYGYLFKAGIIKLDCRASPVKRPTS
jgi:hypothetical protein